MPHTFRLFTVALAASLFIAGCSIIIEPDNPDVSKLNCEELTTRLTDGKTLYDEIERSGKSMFELVHEGADSSFQGRWFVRLLVWDAGSREAAEAIIKQGHHERVKLFEKEIAARCS